MKTHPFLAAGWLCLFLAPLWLTGCAGSQENGDAARRPPPNQQRTAPPPGADLNLEIAGDEVQTIQLYAGEQDRLPILPLRGNRTLTLEFDLMAPSGRPLSAYFYHANRTWRRDLTAPEYLSSFNRDDLFDYTRSRSTRLDYVHYTYSFPNRNIGFRISGNYILRITEQGREDEVLFERAFFVTEEAAALQFDIDNVMVSGQGAPSAQPILAFDPPSSLGASIYDYNVCFVQNGRLENTRCSDRPTLNQQPSLLFFLQPDAAFEPQASDYYLDLRDLRIGGDILDVDRSVEPYRVVLEPDFARFPANSLDPLLNGQSVVGRDTDAEYAQVRFSFVPPGEEPVAGGLMLTGSFNGWAFDLANQLTWVAEAGRYEGDLLIKQGQYEYRYVNRQGGLSRALRGTLPRSENQYSAFVYFSDASLSTDRLLAAQTIRAP